MLESWIVCESLARERQRDMLAHAAVARLLAGRPRRSRALPWLRGRLRSWLGRELVALGVRLQDRRASDGEGPLKKAS
jgi:hypothetical protein